jgi:hypothetical protein
MGLNADSPYGAWLQATNRVDLSIEYPLLLNPNGGNVGIGTTSPGTSLNVVGTGSNLVSIFHTDSNTTLAGTSTMVPLSVRNMDTTNNNWSLLQSIGSGGSIDAAIGFQHINHASNYAEIAFGTRGASGWGERMRIGSTGNVGIGTTSPQSKLHISETKDISSGAYSSVKLYPVFTGSSLTGNSNTGLDVLTNVQANGDLTARTVTGSKLAIGYPSNASASSTTATLIGVQALSTNDGVSLTLGSATGLLAKAGTVRSTATVTTSTAIESQIYATGTSTTAYLFHGKDKDGSGAITNQYGIYIDDLTGGATSNYAIYTAGTTQSYFGGSVGIGVTSPTETLHVEGGIRLGSTSDANNVLDTASSGGSPSGDLYWGSRVVCDDSGNCSGTGAGIGGSGTANYIAKFSGQYNITNSLLYDNDTAIGIGTTAPASLLDVNGTITGNTLSDGTATLSSGTLDLGTNTIYDGNLTGNWAFNSGNLTGIGDLSVDGNTTLGDAAGDTLTIDAGSWTITNQTAVDLVGSTVNALSFETNLLSLDTDNSRVGIGTTSPSATLTVSGAGTFSGLLTGTLGATISGATTSVNASSNFDTNINTGTSTGAISIGNSSAGAITFASGAASSFTVTNNDLTLQTDTTGAINLVSASASSWDLPNSTVNALSFETNLLTLDTNGTRVGIGTTAPASLFHVAGTARLGLNGTDGGLIFYNDNASGGNDYTVSFTLSDDQDQNITYILPPNDGDPSQVLTTSGDGTLTWTSSSGGISGTGTDNYIPRWNGTSALEDSIIFDDGSNHVGIGTSVPTQTFQVNETASNPVVITSGGLVGIGTTSPGGRLDILSSDTTGPDFRITNTGAVTGTVSQILADSLTSGTAFDLSVDAITSGTALNISSTSTAASGSTTGLLGYFNWSPTGSTEIYATGDLVRINVGQYANIGNIFNITDTGSSVFSVSQTQITSALPHQFTAAGDVSVAYDIQFTNQVSSFIKSNAPLTIEAGESFENNSLTLKTYGTGAVVVDRKFSFGSQKTLPVNDATPSVSTGNQFITANTTSTTTITNFDDGTTGQVIFIKVNDAYTDISCTGSYIDCGTTDITSIASGDALEFYFDGTQWNLLAWMINGTNNADNGDGVDVAEYYLSDESLQAGEVVKVDSGGSMKVAKSDGAYQFSAIGVVSTNPGITLGDSGEGAYPIALAGQVPVKVTDINGAIHAGDPIASSDIPGVAMKASKSGNIIGTALENWNPNSGKDTVTIFVNPTWHESPTTLADPLITSLFSEDNGKISLNLDNINVTDLTVIGDTLLGDTVVSGNLTVGGITFDPTANSIDAIGTLEIQPMALGNIELMGGLVTIDTQGDVVAQEITAKKYNVAGASAGSSKITAGQVSVFVSSGAVSEDSLIFTTPKTTTDSNLAVTTKTSGSGFKVEIPSPTSSNIEFDWWIVDKLSSN